jgi:hypothetical protein
MDKAILPISEKPLKTMRIKLPHDWTSAVPVRI